MSRTRAVPPKATRSSAAKPTKPSALGNSVGMDRSTKWRCSACTFLTEGDTCQTCGAPKSAPPPLPHARKPVQGLQPRERPEEVKSEVYFDPVDGSMNVPIAGIKKYYPRQETNTVPKVPVPKLPGNVHTIREFEEEAQHPQRAPQHPQHPAPNQPTRDLLGMLQAADTSDALPMMRNKGKKAGRKK